MFSIPVALLVAFLTLAAGIYAYVARRCPWVLGRKFRRGFFPLSGSPITLGHIDVIGRAARRCIELIVVIGKNPNKTPLFSHDECLEMARRLIREAGLTNVTVMGSSGLQVDFVAKHNCDAVFRGVRNATDLAYERGEVAMSCLMQPGYDRKVYFIKASRQWQHMSSTVVRLSATFGVVVRQWTAPFIEELLVTKMGRWHVRVTGDYSLTYGYANTVALAETLVRHLISLKIQAKLVDFAELRKQALNEASPAGGELRSWLMETFGADVLNADHAQVNLDKLDVLLHAIGYSSNTYEELEQRLRVSMMRLYRGAVLSFKGVLVHTWHPDFFRPGEDHETQLMLHRNVDCSVPNPQPAHVAQLVEQILKEMPKDLAKMIELPAPVEQRATA